MTNCENCKKLANINSNLRIQKGAMTNLAWLLLDRLAGGSFTFSILDKKIPPDGANIELIKDGLGSTTFKAVYPNKLFS